MKIRKIGLLAFVVVTAISFGSGNSRADETNYYEFHPMSILALGAGYSPNQLSQSKYKCVNFAEYPADPGSLSTEMNAFFVGDSDSLKEVLNLDTKVDASYLAYNGSISFNFSDEQMFKKDSATLVIRAFTEYGRKMMKDPVLTPSAQALIDSGRMKEFENQCGSHVVTVERRGAMAAAMITLSNLTLTQKATLGAEVNASGHAGIASGSAKAAFQHLMESSNGGTSVNVQVIATGGKGFSDLGALVTGLNAGSDNLTRIESALADFIKAFGPDNAAPIGFHTAPMGFGFDPDGIDLWDSQKQRMLSRLVAEYRSTVRLEEALSRILSTDDPRALLITSAERSAYAAAIPKLQAYEQDLATAHSACMRTQALSACNLPSTVPPQMHVPELPEVPRLLATPTAPGAKATDLEIQGIGLIQIEIWMNQSLVGRMPITGASTGLEDRSVLVPLEKYWKYVRTDAQGGYTGSVLITDAYGRKIRRIFNRGFYAATGDTTPIYDQFSRVGEL